ncbi:universal stress protein [Mycobacterium kansasii]|uniref:Universal stress protein/MSMEI_3859 n=1 Tax=Mycobacterium attenuatum TaxID=2341086 RepID=A0A498PR21_9MYCO|nr:universal stress protein [Mycobacterium attenuatum]ORB85388.1 universal stress protein [Mycobacterium kansasii]VBA34408.1 Universal stress protein/MSMEI_3859 [Mycobacterium attenuatum]
MPVDAIVGYDGSPGASAALAAGALLFPGAHGWITYLWVPPFASDKVRRRLRPMARDANELAEMIEREGEREAQRIVEMGVTLASAAGWRAEPLLKRTWGSEGLRIAQAVDDAQADVVVVGARGLGGAQAALGSVSDMVLHYCPKPVVVVPHPMLSAEYEALANGPVLVGWDGSGGAATALAAAKRLCPQRDVLLISVGDGPAPGPPVGPSGAAAADVLRLTINRGHGFRARAVSEALVAAADDHNAALVVVGSRGRSGARDVVLGSVAVGTVHHSHRPVMVVPGGWEVAAGS